MALIKYLEFGGTDQNTGEKRVTLIEDSLIKTASNEIQDYWRNLVRKPDCFYLHVIAMSAGEYWGPNRRADWYGEENLKKYHSLFVTQAKVYKHHINRPDSPSYGRVLYSFYNDNMHRVELILEVDKSNSQEYVEKIKNGEDIYVSMGMRVPKDECSICGNVASRLDEYCEHGKLLKNKVLEDDRLVYRINHAPYNLFDISLVTRPADPVAWAMEKAASYIPRDSSNTIAVYDEDTFQTTNLLKTAVDKFADLIKEVDLQSVEQDANEDNDVNIKKNTTGDITKKIHIFIKADKRLPIPIKLPSLSYTQMEELNIHPAIPLLSAMLGNVHLSLDELAYYIGKIYLKNLFNKNIHRVMISNLPIGIHNLQRNPINLIHSIAPIVEAFATINRVELPFSNELVKLQPHITNTRDTINMLKFAGLLPERETPYNNPQMYHVREAANNNNIVELVNNNDPMDIFIAKKNDANSIINKEGKDATKNVIKIIGSITALAGIASIITGKSEKIMEGIPAVVIGGIMMSKGLLDKKEKPTDFSVIEKKADDSLNLIEAIQKIANIGTMVGLATPAALAADYIYATHRAKNNPEYEQKLVNGTSLAYNIGRAVTQHPVAANMASLIGAGTLKGVGKALLKRKFSR